ncbi:hypothetical protein EJ06DRAFT_530593 [Trichodelitschia bisporula]|uniref:Uncharacterized protein n=1 Tax=Trichodelitschia bisporula TaxID=703511 RepID=A0A6G1HUS5_9PEZI|nr:hypothetical protein EJ06DRAFT_530593 [Trichodelitschia bisporula]
MHLLLNPLNRTSRDGSSRFLLPPCAPRPRPAVKSSRRLAKVEASWYSYVFTLLHIPSHAPGFPSTTLTQANVVQSPRELPPLHGLIYAWERLMAIFYERQTKQHKCTRWSTLVLSSSGANLIQPTLVRAKNKEALGK